jgi:hypothetical protein
LQRNREHHGKRDCRQWQHWESQQRNNWQHRHQHREQEQGQGQEQGQEQDHHRWQ